MCRGRGTGEDKWVGTYTKPKMRGEETKGTGGIPGKNESFRVFKHVSQGFCAR